MLNPRVNAKGQSESYALDASALPAQPAPPTMPPILETDTEAPQADIPITQAQIQEQAQPPMRTLDTKRRFNFSRARDAGASDSDLLAFLQKQDTNINWDALDSITQDPSRKIAMLARNDWNFYASAATPSKEAQQAEGIGDLPPTPTLQNTPTSPPPPLKETSPIHKAEKPKEAQALQNIGNKDFLDIVGEALGYETDNAKRINSAIDDYVYRAQKEGKAFDELDTKAQEYYAKKAHSEKGLFNDIFTTPQELAKKAYDKEIKTLEIANTPLDKLSDEQKAFIKNEASALQKVFNNDEEIYREFIETKRAEKIVPKEMKHALEVLDNLHGYKDIASILTGADDELKADYLDSVDMLARNMGFQGIGTNQKGELFIQKDGNFYRVESGFIESLPTLLAANAGSIGAGIAGSVAGFKYGARLGGVGGALGAIIGGGIGAFVGGAGDVALGNVYLNRENTAKEILRHATQEGILSVVGDSLIMGAIKAYDKFNKEGLKNAIGTIAEYTPIVGFLKRAQDGNAAQAARLIEKQQSKETQEELTKIAHNLGAELHIGAQNKGAIKEAVEGVVSKLGEDNQLALGARKFYDIFSLQDQKKAQKEFIQSIRSDENGGLLAFITEVANSSPNLQANLKNILHDTTLRLKRQLTNLNLPKNTIKNVFENVEKGTKASYNEAIEEVLGSTFNNKYKVNLNDIKANITNIESTMPKKASDESVMPRADVEALKNTPTSPAFNVPTPRKETFTQFKERLENFGVLADASKPFIQFVEKNIYNPKGVTFSQLNNALKTINSYYKEASDPNLRTYIKQAIDGFLRQDIKAGIDAIFKQVPDLTTQARSLFETALSDYALMKDSLKLVDKLKIRDRAQNYNNIVNRMSKFFLAQGDELPNFTRLTQAVPKEMRAELEIKLLEDMLENSLTKMDKVEVLNTGLFFERLSPIKEHLQTPLARQFIDIVGDFHTLFKNDARILESLKGATTERIGSSIATTLEGAVKFQIIKELFSNIIRLMPYIPFMNRFNEKVQGAALRFHLKKALDSALSVGELKIELKAPAFQARFNNATREKIGEFMQALERAEGNIAIASKKAKAQLQQAKANTESSIAKADMEALQETPTLKAEAEEVSLQAKPQADEAQGLTRASDTETSLKAKETDELATPSKAEETPALAKEEKTETLQTKTEIDATPLDKANLNKESLKNTKHLNETQTQALKKLETTQAETIPQELDIEGFFKQLNQVENKENFIKHLSSKTDAQARLAYLNLIEPTLKEPDLILKSTNANKEPTKEFIKAFKDKKGKFFYIVITQDNANTLLTAFKTNKLRELKNRIRKARDFEEISSAHRFNQSSTAEQSLKNNSLKEAKQTQELIEHSQSQANINNNLKFTTTQAKGIKDLRIQTKQNLKPILNTEIINTATKLKGFISTNEVN